MTVILQRAPSLTEQCLEAIDEVGGTSREVADELGLDAQQVSMILKDLYRAKRLDRVQIEPGARDGSPTTVEFFYFKPGCKPAWLEARRKPLVRSSGLQKAGGIMYRQFKWELA